MPRMPMRKRGPAAALRRRWRWLAPRTKFRININGDGYQEVDLQAPSDGAGPELGGQHRGRHPGARCAR